VAGTARSIIWNSVHVNVYGMGVPFGALLIKPTIRLGLVRVIRGAVL
jgi:hypothetical protein